MAESSPPNFEGTLRISEQHGLDYRFPRDWLWRLLELIGWTSSFRAMSRRRVCWFPETGRVSMGSDISSNSISSFPNNANDDARLETNDDCGRNTCEAQHLPMDEAAAGEPCLVRRRGPAVCRKVDPPARSIMATPSSSCPNRTPPPQP
jgi:hypothetical protein